MASSVPKKKLPLTFFLLVFALSLPFWILGSLIEQQLLPGIPASALMFVCPALAASVLEYRRNGLAGVRRLFGRSFDYERVRAWGWYLPAVFLMPGVTVLVAALMRLTGRTLALPHLSVFEMLLAAAFFVAALGEELGWTGYAAGPLRRRLGTPGAGVLLGLVWAAWHLVPLAQAHRTPEWILWWCLFTVASRVLYVWLYVGAGGSVFAVALFHASSNVCTVLFADLFDPRITGPVVVLAAAAVTLGWRGRGSASPSQRGRS